MLNLLGSLLSKPSGGPAPNVVSLKVNGKAWEGWKEVKITRSLKAIAGSFSLSVADNSPKTSGQTWIAGPGAKAILEIDGEPVIEGFVDSLSANLSATDRTVAIEGREKTADLVDCCIERHEFLNATLEGVARSACSLYGIAIRNDAGVRKSYGRMAISNGETVFAVLEKLARRDAVLLTSDGLGTLVIARIGSKTIPGVLEEGVNLLSIGSKFDDKGRFSEIVVKGQHNEADMDPALLAGPVGRAYDKGIDRFRLLTVNLETSGSREDAQKRANWELTTRQAKAIEVTAKVQGWRSPDGSLWKPNSLIAVKAPSVAVEATLLITDVSFSQSIGEGTTTELRLTRRDAFIPEPSKPDQAELYRRMILANKKAGA